MESKTLVIWVAMTNHDFRVWIKRLLDSIAIAGDYTLNRDRTVFGKFMALEEKVKK